MKKLRNYRPGGAGEIKINEEEELDKQTIKAVEELPVKKRRFFRKNRATEEETATERVMRPIISEEKSAPKAKTEIRDRLEELLIERIAVNPKDIEAYERLGEYYLEIRSYTDSKECFKQVLKLDPKNRNAKYRMRRLENLLAKE